MMDVREKLVEILKKKPFSFSDYSAGRLSEHLVANSVTVQEWISVEDRLPKPETDVIAFAGDYIDILSYRYDRRGNLAFMYMDDSGWWHERIRPSVTHWQYLPQPPKGE